MSLFLLNSEMPVYGVARLHANLLSVPGDLVHEGVADQPRLNSVVQLGRELPRVDNGNKY